MFWKIIKSIGNLISSIIRIKQVFYGEIIGFFQILLNIFVVSLIDILKF